MRSLKAIVGNVETLYFPEPRGPDVQTWRF